MEAALVLLVPVLQVDPVPPRRVARVEEAGAAGGDPTVVEAEVAHRALRADGLDDLDGAAVADRVAVELELLQGL